LTTRNLSCTSFPFRVSSARVLWFPSVTPALSRTTCATHFLALPVTADRVLAMDAKDVVRQLVGFGMVAGHVMNLQVNGSQRAPTHGERFHLTSIRLDASPGLGHAIVCSACAVPIPLVSSGSALRIYTLGRICGSVASASLTCGGSKTVLDAGFRGV
jgi:hypothetical protein